MFLRQKPFWIDYCIGTLLPSAFLLVGIALVVSALGPKPGAWLPGPTCDNGKLQEFASPNGRFIATSLLIDCEDHPKRNRTYNYVFLSASRLDRIGHVFTLSHERTTPIELVWLDNQSVGIRNEPSDTEEGISAKWCGITTTFQDISQ